MGNYIIYIVVIYLFIITLVGIAVILDLYEGNNQMYVLSRDKKYYLFIYI